VGERHGNVPRVMTVGQTRFFHHMGERGGPSERKDFHVSATQGSKSPTHSFVALVEWMGLDPTRDFRGAKLRGVNFRFDGIVIDLSALASLVVLETLNLAGSAFKNLKGLAALVGLLSLRSLDPERTGIADLGPLRSAHLLETLDMQSTMVTDLRPIGRLTRLRMPRLHRTDVSARAGPRDLTIEW
jgi:hypothetical protein